MQLNNYAKNPIEQIVESSISNITKAAETNTIIGQPFITSDGSTILPISQLSFAFVAGGGEYDNKNKNPNTNFAGGSGGGATLNPIGFLVSNANGIKLVKFEEDSPIEKFADFAASIIEGFKNKAWKKSF